jgi:hypothetical protein
MALVEEGRWIVTLGQYLTFVAVAMHRLFRNIQNGYLTARTVALSIYGFGPVSGFSYYLLTTCWTALWIDPWNRPQSPVR